MGEVSRRHKCFTTLQSGHLLLYQCRENNSEAGIGFVIIKKRNVYCLSISSLVNVSNTIPREALCITKRYKLTIVQEYPQISSHE